MIRIENTEAAVSDPLTPKDMALYWVKVNKIRGR